VPPITEIGRTINSTGMA
jgi:hypothetical protein